LLTSPLSTVNERLELITETVEKVIANTEVMNRSLERIFVTVERIEPIVNESLERIVELEVTAGELQSQNRDSNETFRQHSTATRDMSRRFTEFGKSLSSR
jgi:methyl-accepting chemotaxis protein